LGFDEEERRIIGEVEDAAVGDLGGGEGKAAFPWSHSDARTVEVVDGDGVAECTFGDWSQPPCPDATGSVTAVGGIEEVAIRRPPEALIAVCADLHPIFFGRCFFGGPERDGAFGGGWRRRNEAAGFGILLHLFERVLDVAYGLVAAVGILAEAAEDCP
jgi:hypothetical protein